MAVCCGGCEGDRKAAVKSKCAHCGNEFEPQADEVYCCNGCSYTAQQISSEDLERFYTLRGSQPMPPVGAAVFGKAEYGWLEQQLAAAKVQADGTAATTVQIKGISCLGCVWLIESVFRRQPGAVDVAIDPRKHTMQIIWQQGHFDGVAFARQLHRIGYYPVSTAEDAKPASASARLAFRLGLCGFLLMNTMLFTLPGYLGMGADYFLADYFDWLAALFATASLVTGGSYFFVRAWQAAKMKTLHIDMPIAAGLLVGYVGSVVGWLSGYTSLIYFDFVATFGFLMLFGRWLQEFALERNQAHLSRRNPIQQTVRIVAADAEPQPDAAGGSCCDAQIRIEAIESGQSYALQPGEVTPVSSTLLSDKALLSLEWINGEADPVLWQRGENVPAGAISVGMGGLQLKAQESWSQSLLSQLLRQTDGKFVNHRLQRVIGIYIAIVFVVALVGGGLWLWLSGDVLRAMQVLISVLVVSCPCALGVALPMADEFATTALRRVGLFVKTPDLWERLRRVGHVIFDKTGTLTMETPRLLAPQQLRSLPMADSEFLYQLVRENLHPVARTLKQELLAVKPVLDGLDGAVVPVEETIGKGVSLIDYRGMEWRLGDPEWALQAAVEESGGVQVGDSRGTRTVLSRAGKLVAAFAFAEDVRDDARSVVHYARQRGLRVAILSGDAEVRVKQIASKLDIERQAALGRLSPEEKADWIRRYAPDSALMIGDGANDSMAFKAAVCRGTPVVDRSILEDSADFFFFGRSLKCLPRLFAIADRRRTTVRVVFIFAVVYNVGTVSICLAGMMHPLLAAILMPLSSLITLGITWMGLARTSHSLSTPPPPAGPDSGPDLICDFAGCRPGCTRSSASSPLPHSAGNGSRRKL